MESVTVASNNFVSKICRFLLFFLQKRYHADLKIVCAPLKLTEKKHSVAKFHLDKPGEIPYPGEISYVSN